MNKVEVPNTLLDEIISNNSSVMFYGASPSSIYSHPCLAALNYNQYTELYIAWRINNPKIKVLPITKDFKLLFGKKFNIEIYSTACDNIYIVKIKPINNEINYWFMKGGMTLLGAFIRIMDTEYQKIWNYYTLNDIEKLEDAIYVYTTYPYINLGHGINSSLLYKIIDFKKDITPNNATEIKNKIRNEINIFLNNIRLVFGTEKFDLLDKDLDSSFIQTYPSMQGYEFIYELILRLIKRSET